MHNAAEFAYETDDVFGRIASRYDLLCDVFSFGMHRAYLTYMSLCMPVLGWLATGGDASAYRYLLHGIKDFPSADALSRELAAHGFEDVGYERLSLGIVAIHWARKPQGASPARSAP